MCLEEEEEGRCAEQLVKLSERGFKSERHEVGLQTELVTPGEQEANAAQRARTKRGIGEDKELLH